MPAWKNRAPTNLFRRGYLNVIPTDSKKPCDFALLCIKWQTNCTVGSEVKNYIAEVTRIFSVEVMSETKSTGGDTRVFQSHHFNKAALQGSSVFQERLKCGTREFVGYMQTVNSSINKDGSDCCSHDPQKDQPNSLNFKHILYWYR